LKIYLLDLAHTYSVTDSSLTVPLGIGYIKAYLKQEMGDDIDVTLFKNPTEVLSRIGEDQPDVVGFANYGWNRDLNQKIGAYIREILPDALMVAGGPNIDNEDEARINFLKEFSFLDFVIILGGEEPFAELIKWRQAAGAKKGSLPGNLIWLEGEKLCSTPQRPLKKIIENIPSPYLTGYLDEFIARGMVPMLETNRGCPFSCTFCAWGMASQDLVRRFDHQRALQEIAYIGERSQAINWIVCDANFGILKRDVDLAKAIRHVKDTMGFPQQCHVWTAKNTTGRNLQIGKILGDMAVPVMAVQSMDEQVLKNIKRSNISLDTYEEYHAQFQAMGSKTYSDVIVPLPAETLESHISGIARLMALGVNTICNHNMRLLAGAETNSRESREKFDFKTRFRLIHGDAGRYETPDGKEIRSFEYEESLRSTTSMDEQDLFYLRKLHFLIDFCWNSEVYKPLFNLLQSKGGCPALMLKKMLTPMDGLVPQETAEKLRKFWDEFDLLSRQEWFDTAEDIEAYFAKDENFNRLINLEFEKLNTLFAVKVLRQYKKEFDHAMAALVMDSLSDDHDLVAGVMDIVSSLFPPLDFAADEVVFDVSGDILQNRKEGKEGGDQRSLRLRFYENDRRKQVKKVILESEGKTLSKIMDAQGIHMSQLKFSLDEEFGAGRQFKKYLNKLT